VCPQQKLMTCSYSMYKEASKCAQEQHSVSITHFTCYTHCCCANMSSHLSYLCNSLMVQLLCIRVYHRSCSTMNDKSSTQCCYSCILTAAMCGYSCGLLTSVATSVSLISGIIAIVVSPVPLRSLYRNCTWRLPLLPRNSVPVVVQACLSVLALRRI
jgi:hypothetical protein